MADFEFSKGESTGFWRWGTIAATGEYGAILDVDAVVKNTLANMRRLEEEVTLKVVIDFLRDKGYIVIAPEEEGP